jgi:hypothetical protein
MRLIGGRLPIALWGLVALWWTSQIGSAAARTTRVVRGGLCARERRSSRGRVRVAAGSGARGNVARDGRR